MGDFFWADASFRRVGLKEGPGQDVERADAKGAVVGVGERAQVGLWVTAKEGVRAFLDEPPGRGGGGAEMREGGVRKCRCPQLP